MWRWKELKTAEVTDEKGRTSYRPPSCPQCNNPLFRVNRVKLNFTVMEFDVNYGAFEEGLRHNDYFGRMVCPHCGHVLGNCLPA
jgi:hypothetical protein